MAQTAPQRASHQSKRGARPQRRAPRRVRAALLSNGAEILEGLYPDTNAQWLAHRLDALGFDVVATRAVGDSRPAVQHALRTLSEEADLILSTGGLGPTEDDLLREACAELWQCPLKFHQGLMDEITAFHHSRGRRHIPASNRRQAHLPCGAEPLGNRWGTAPGFILPAWRDLATLIALPGPPIEMRPMFEQRALPWLRGHLWPGVVRGRTVIHTLGWPEAAINERLSSLFAADERLQLTILARSGKIDVRLTATDTDERSVRECLSRWRRWVRRRLPTEIVWGRDDETLEQVVNRLLVRRRWTVAVAESCTGGLVAERLTAVPGASRILTHAVVTYANEAKENVLRVPRQILQRHGAVSEECVREMAKGVRRWAKADLGLAISGIAGPTGGTREKPVGLVWVAAATAAGVTTERHLIPRREREAIRQWAADRLLNLARRVIQARAS